MTGATLASPKRSVLRLPRLRSDPPRLRSDRASIVRHSNATASAISPPGERTIEGKNELRSNDAANGGGLLLLLGLNLLLSVLFGLSLLLAVLLGLNLLLHGAPLSRGCNIVGRRRSGIAGRRWPDIAGRRRSGIAGWRRSGIARAHLYRLAHVADDAARTVVDRLRCPVAPGPVNRLGVA